MFHFTCNDVSGCPAPGLLKLGTLTWGKLKSEIPWPENGIWGFASWKVTGWLLAYYAFSLLLGRILPAEEAHGTKLRASGRPLTYHFNGRKPSKAPINVEQSIWESLTNAHCISAFSSTVVQLFICAVGTAVYGAEFVVWTFIVDNYLQLLTASTILAYFISIFVYIKSFEVKPNDAENRELAQGGNTGNTIYDFYIGRELNPRITLPLVNEQIDIKTWLEMRPGLTGWILLDLAFISKQYATYGYVSDSIIFTAIVQIYYVLEGQYFESGILGMMDITTDGMGFMLTFGDIVWVPFLYSTQCRYLSTHPISLGWMGVAAVSTVFLVGLYIFRSSNSQKQRFRSTPNHPSIKDLPYIQTRRGTRLLTGGWWGMARHMNYFGDWLQASPFSLPTGVAGYAILPAGSAVEGAIKMLDGREVVQGAARGWGTIFTYFYVVYFAILLIHREGRDDVACSEKYGEDWDRYKKTVKWRIVPGVY